MEMIDIQREAFAKLEIYQVHSFNVDCSTQLLGTTQELETQLSG